MSLSSSLFTGTSGLKNMGNALQVTGNNIANLNTIGFKKGRSTFADTLYENVATLGGTDQIGRGMTVGDVAQNFNQGSFESTGNATDLSIGGDGFFVMRQANSENTYYTRAGNFLFNKEGELVNPEGYVVQGWELDEETGNDIGAIGDIVMQAFTSPPKKSTLVTAVTNLNADAAPNSGVLSNAWDSGNDIPMGATNYEYPTVLKVYDALGSTHDVSIFYDKKSGTEWEYVVTTNPSEDNRNSVQGTESKGLLARGTILFSQSSGDVLDITMDRFTGRLGNFQAEGANTKDDINYQILNSDEFTKDGYGFDLEFDGSAWNFVDLNKNGIIDPSEKPDNYPNAVIVYSDSGQVHLVLNQTSPTQTDPDLKIKLDKAAAATDTLGFDINDPNDLHAQNVVNFSYPGTAIEGSNTDMVISDPSVMTHDSTGLGIVWNPNAGVGGKGEWFWSNPEIANSAGTLVSGVTVTDSFGADIPVTTASTTITNASDMTMVASNIKMRHDGIQWDWNEGVKEDDFISNYDNLLNANNVPALTVTGSGSQGAIATNTALALPTLYWQGTEWSLTSSGGATTSALVGNTYIAINAAASNNQTANFDIWYGAGNSAGLSTAQYSFGTALAPTTAPAGTAVEYIEFTMDPTPPQEYADAVITASTSLATPQGFDIDFDDDNEVDLRGTPTAGAAAAFAAGSTFVFSVNPDVPPTEYANATLKGDHESAIIDLDGSGNDSDNDDIVFTFAEPLKFATTTPSWDDRGGIDFDILGSTAWTTISKQEIQTTGYFSFQADFLGGEYGTTETDIELNFGSVYENSSFVNGSLSTTQYSKSSSTVFQDANGYGAGDLQGVNVASDGILTGVYSNGQLIPLFRVGLAKFLNNYGLQNEGGNLFRETRESGSAITNKPGENGLGTIAPNSLEMSNVDISEEFVNMITNQRGFQANSKTITTVDDMMQTVIQMKR